MKKFSEQFDFALSGVIRESGNKVARNLGSHQGLVNRYRSGATAPPVEFTQKFCDYYGISANWLLLDIGPIRLADLENTEGQHDSYEKTLILLKGDMVSIRNKFNEICDKYEL